MSSLRWMAYTCERDVFALSHFLDLGMVAAVSLPQSSVPVYSSCTFFVIGILGWSNLIILIDFPEKSFVTHSHFRYLTMI